jgi:hypothetical protein
MRPRLCGDLLTNIGLGRGKVNIRATGQTDVTASRAVAALRIAPEVIGRAVDVLLDHSGTLWVAAGENVVARLRNDAQFQHRR